ncbi:MAG: glycosyltransferase family 4 protein [Candidatus Bathyarchaeota archaeon]|nr:glycosyltransferase family 4 protein [Candidatus Bathyarchaeota archaeon]
MRILHLIDSFDARFERDQVKLVALLEEKGYQNTVVTSRYSSDNRLTAEALFKSWEKQYHLTKIIHAPSIKIPTPLLLDPSKNIYLPPRDIFKEVDIVHAYSCATYSSFIGATLKTAKRTRFVMRSDMSPVAYNKARDSSLYRALLTYPFRRANAVYVYSDFERRCLTSLGVLENKIHVIPVGINFSKFGKYPAADPKEPVTIGFLGRFAFVKGIHRAVPALQRILKEENVVVIFSGILEDAEYAEETMTSLKKFRTFSYKGSLSLHPDRFYELCDVVIVPSLYETGAITVLEAMASGRAVVASDIYPIKEYIQHGTTGFLFSDAEELYSCLKQLLDNPDLIRKIGERAKRKAEQHDWKTIIDKYEEMYRNVLHN